MAMKEVAGPGSVTFVKWGEVAEDTTIKAYYMDTKPSSKYPNQKIHYVETKDGARYGLNGNANLDRMFQEIRQGWFIHLTYKGTDVIESGRFAGKDCHQFALKYDDENVHPLYSGTPKENVTYKDDAERPADETEKESVKETSKETLKETPALVKPSSNAPTKEEKPKAAKRSVF